MSKYRDIDQLALHFLSLNERWGRIASVDFIAIRSELCAYCGKAGKTEFGPPGSQYEGCMYCRRNWVGGNVIEVPKWEVDASKKAGRGEDNQLWMIDELKLLEPMFRRSPRSMPLGYGHSPGLKPVDRWHFSVQSYLAFLHPALGSWNSVVEWGLEYRPKYTCWWTYSRAQRSGDFARSKLFGRAVKRRLLHWKSQLNPTAE